MAFPNPINDWGDVNSGKHEVDLIAVEILIISKFKQLNFDQENGDFSFRSEREGTVYVFGLVAIGCATLTSGFAGVYNEKLIKNGQQSSLLIRSIQLS